MTSLLELQTATEVRSLGRCVPVQRFKEPDLAAKFRSGGVRPNVHLASPADVVAVLLGMAIGQTKFQVLSDKLHLNLPVYAPCGPTDSVTSLQAAMRAAWAYINSQPVSAAPDMSSKEDRQQWGAFFKAWLKEQEQPQNIQLAVQTPPMEEDEEDIFASPIKEAPLIIFERRLTGQQLTSPIGSAPKRAKQGMTVMLTISVPYCCVAKWYHTSTCAYAAVGILLPVHCIF